MSINKLDDFLKCDNCNSKLEHEHKCVKKINKRKRLYKCMFCDESFNHELDMNVHLLFKHKMYRPMCKTELDEKHRISRPNTKEIVKD